LLPVGFIKLRVFFEKPSFDIQFGTPAVEFVPQARNDPTNNLQHWNLLGFWVLGDGLRRNNLVEFGVNMPGLAWKPRAKMVSEGVWVFEEVKEVVGSHWSAREGYPAGTLITNTCTAYLEL
jgi:hypothetical protein